MTRPDFAGASGRCTLAEARRLGDGWVAQEKADGAYCTLVLDGGGRVSEVLTRRGRPVSDRVHRLHGEVVGAPWSIVVGELESFTESGRRAAASRPGGLPGVWLFDAVQVGRERVAERPYAQRRDALMRAWVELGTERPALRDDSGRWHDGGGRFVAQREAGWQRVRPVEQHPASRVESVWRDVVEVGQGEGLVLVNQRAPMGARRSKLKVKPVDGVEVTVVSADERRAIVHWLACDRFFAVGRVGRDVVPGEIWTVTHNGFYDDATPRFARLDCRRADLM